MRLTGKMMASDSDWLEDVRRWYFSAEKQAERPAPITIPKTKASSLDQRENGTGASTHRKMSDDVESGYAGLN